MLYILYVHAHSTCTWASHIYASAPGSASCTICCEVNHISVFDLCFGTGGLLCDILCLLWNITFDYWTYRPVLSCAIQLLHTVRIDVYIVEYLHYKCDCTLDTNMRLICMCRLIHVYVTVQTSAVFNSFMQVYRTNSVHNNTIDSSTVYNSRVQSVYVFQVH